MIRNIRVGLWECGWFRERGLFPIEPRNFLLLVIGPHRGQSLVEKYRDTAELRAAIPYSHKLHRLPPQPIVGEAGYQDIVQILRSKQRHMTRSERIMAEDVSDYLRFKLTMARGAATEKFHNFENSERDADPIVS